MKYRNPQYTANNAIDCEIEHPDYGWIPFTADPNDVEEHGRAIYADIMANADIAPYVPPPPPTDEEVAAQVRAERDQLLAATDWTQAADVPEEVRIKWQPYRQALRDVPQQKGFPHEVVWPEKPNAQLSTAINVNTATKDELRSLSGVDAVRAQAIIDGRPWASVDDLATIQGISSDMIAGWDITV